MTNPVPTAPTTPAALNDLNPPDLKKALAAFLTLANGPVLSSCESFCADPTGSVSKAVAHVLDIPPVW